MKNDVFWRGGEAVKKSQVIIFTVAICIMTLCITVGYAALSDNLGISGNLGAEAQPPKGVYIKAVEVYSTSSADSLACGYSLPTNHTATVDSRTTGGSVTYKITVHNNTDVTYWYIEPQCSTDYGQNMLIVQDGGISIRTMDHPSDTTESFNSEDWIPPQTERDFYVRYTYGASAQSVCKTMVNFKFDIKMDAVHDEFLAVLNNSYSSNSYDQLVGAFESEYAKDGSTSISTESHPELFESLFGDLTVNIDGVERQASVVIRRDNLDRDATSGDDYSGSGPKGCEYTLYITVESLTPGTSPTVYAISYSCGANAMGTDWYQVGELYEGTAQINSDGSINYDTWTATHKTYEIADGITYVVGAPNGDQYDIMKTLDQLISAEDQDVFNQIDNTHIFKKAYDIIQKHQGSDDPAVEGLRIAFQDASKFYINYNNGQEFKVVRNTYTRAEIIYALKNIQAAMDYYYQAYPE